MRFSVSRVSLAVFAAHAVMTVAAQVQNTVVSPHLQVADILPWQWMTLATSLACAVLYELARHSRWTKWLFHALFITLLAAIAGNQFFYQIFQDTLTISHLDEFQTGDADNIAASVRSEVGVFQYVNIALLLASVAALFAAEWRWAAERAAFTLRGPALAGAAVSGLALFAALVWARPEPASQIDKATAHIALSVWRGWPRQDETTVNAADVIRPPELFQLVNGTPLPPGEDAAALAQASAFLKARKRNIVMVVLESVGARQLLRDGKPRPELAPYLHNAASNAVIFDTVTNQFPGSTRAHVGMTTGGPIPTWSSVTSSLIFPYERQNTISEYRAGGWATALFSSAYLKYENLKSFYDRLGYDVVLTADNPANGLAAAKNPGGWGVDEYAVMARAMDWVRQTDKPFLLQFHTISTHHPYIVPPAHAQRFGGTSNAEKYDSTIRFTDQLLADLAAEINKMGKSADTLLVVIGDHGEAFGDLHPDNFTHKNYLYEENIGNFLMIVDLGKTLKPVSSHRRAAIADVMPTLIAMQGMTPDASLPGQDLMSPAYKERLTFFFKSAYPEQWGVRDGQWKFIANRLEGDSFELYDLTADPGEKTNLAGSHPDWAAQYRKLAANWYVYLDEAFRDGLNIGEDSNVPKVALAELTKEGPVEIAVGSFLDPLPFRKLKTVHPDESLTVWTYGGEFKKATPVDYIFTSPSGKESRQTLTFDPDWVNVNYFAPLTSPREEGEWNVRLETAGRILIESRFTVAKSAPLLWSAFDTTPGVRFVRPSLLFGDEFQIINRMNPKQSIFLLIGLQPFAKEALHTAVITAPDGVESYFSFMVKDGWKRSWIPVPQGRFGSDGTYRIEIYHEGRMASSTEVKIDKSALLMKSVDTN